MVDIEQGGKFSAAIRGNAVIAVGIHGSTDLAEESLPAQKLNGITHVDSCPYKPVECSYKERGCRDIIGEIHLSHHTAICGYRPSSCTLCGQEFNAMDIENHEKNECPEGITDCPYNCGTKRLKRRELDDHKSVCPTKPSECQFKVLGCDFTGDKSAVENHQKNVFKHFDFMVTFLCKLDEKQKEIESVLQREVDQLKNLLNKEIKNLKLKIVTQSEKNLKLERKSDEMAAELNILREEITQLRQAVNQSIVSGGQRNDPQQIPDVQIRLAEMDLRFQMIETANYDGTLLWKIRDFSIRRRDAVLGRTVSLYSQPFYSSRFGYKMCARVYLNGDGLGKNTHLSLYFVVMKGEYDALLPWPFGLKITMLLLDQSKSKRHMKDEFLPDPNSTSFHRPQVADMNVASGCPLFVSQATLDDPQNHYVKDDMLFIKVTVDCSQLPRI